MEKKGFGLNQLGLVNDASEKYGGPEKVLKAIEKYKDLQELQNLIKTVTAEQRKLSEQLETDRKETATLERQRKDLSEQIESDTTTLARLKRLRDLGYDDTRLRDLATSASSLGGVQKVLAALGKLHDVNELQLTISELRKTKALLEQEKTNMETANAHLKAHIDATTKLIEEHQLGLDAIAGLLRIAKKYGTPPQVLKAFETYDSLEQLKKEKKKTDDEIKKAKTRLIELTNQEKELRNLVSELLPTIETGLKDWIKGLNEKIDETTKSVTSTLNSQNGAFKKGFNDSLKDVKDLKTILDADFKSIKDNADKQVKALADTMKSTVDEDQKDFAKAFKATKENILDEIKSLLDAAHELDKAYVERKSDLPQLKAFLQLIDLVNEPSKITDISFLSTIQLTLRKTSDWINLNPTKFGYYPSSTDLTDSIRRTEDLLGKVNFEPHPST